MGIDWAMQRSARAGGLRAFRQSVRQGRAAAAAAGAPLAGAGCGKRAGTGRAVRPSLWPADAGALSDQAPHELELSLRPVRHRQPIPQNHEQVAHSSKVPNRHPRL